MHFTTATDLAVLTSNAASFKTDSEAFGILAQESARAKFEKITFDAARKGATNVVVKHLGLPVDSLLKQGFLVEQLVRKKDLLSSLEMAAESSERRGILFADRFIFNNPTFSITGSDQVSHRNPLFSLVCSLWDQGRLTEETTILELETILKSCSNIKDIDLLQHRYLLKSMIDDVKSFKMASAQAEPIKQVHSIMPEGEDSAFKVSWNREASDLDSMLRFSPELLTWFSKNWTLLLGHVNKILQSAATVGFDAAKIDITTRDNNISLLDGDGIFYYLTVKSIPLIYIFNELRLSGLDVAAEVTHYKDGEPQDSYVVNTMYNFKLKEGDILVLCVGWSNFFKD